MKTTTNLYKISILLGVVSWIIFHICVYASSYFTNKAIDAPLLFSMNLGLTTFLIAVVLLILAIFILFRISKKYPQILFNVPIIILTLHTFIIEGLIILANTTNILEPHLSTFTWANYFDYSEYIREVKFKALVVMIILTFSSQYILYKRVLRNQKNIA